MLRLDSISKQYPNNVQAVDNVSLEVADGEIITLIGPSGCGKTTLLRLINRLTEKTSGQIFIEGKEINRWNPIELRRQIGYVIQQVGLFPHLTVEQNISYVLRIMGTGKKKQRERAAELISLVGMDPSYLRRYPAQLSGGQAQRVGFARALAGNPSIILMDEPFGALDQITRLQLQDELLSLQNELKKTVIFVTHDIQEAMKMGDKIVLMRHGQLIQAGKPADFFIRPKEPFVTQFIGGSDFFRLLTFITVDEIITREKRLSAKASLPSGTSLADALQLMFQKNIPEIDVLDGQGNTLGQVSQKMIRNIAATISTDQGDNPLKHTIGS
ncbi:ABC transporter ATP-binding protein [Dethiobacter alkaliphilus]|uniref:Quaternary amine transport ATP-binding protein n=1 Tax=Dethiobacter alkaliphilus AHT 1 TaxID=555088 RepID=C0GFN0_DETAL|nr:ABC transporter ATP-binding protein [Dethiobacter alkaliphilus]EEG77990.1 ABC transporter related protein [Dethiobacter alkaliphilus AHT 1]